jgi:hypothetical protein
MTIYEVKKRLEGYGYVFSAEHYDSTTFMPVYRILKSPRNDHHRNPFRSHSDMCRMIEDEEELMRRRRSERIENILGYDKQ